LPPGGGRLADHSDAVQSWLSLIPPPIESDVATPSSCGQQENDHGDERYRKCASSNQGPTRMHGEVADTPPWGGVGWVLELVEGGGVGWVLELGGGGARPRRRGWVRLGK
jgi:hypothetical protein